MDRQIIRYRSKCLLYKEINNFHCNHLHCMVTCLYKYKLTHSSMLAIQLIQTSVKYFTMWIVHHQHFLQTYFHLACFALVACSTRNSLFLFRKFVYLSFFVKSKTPFNHLIRKFYLVTLHIAIPFLHIIFVPHHCTEFTSKFCRANIFNVQVTWTGKIIANESLINLTNAKNANLA